MKTALDFLFVHWLAVAFIGAGLVALLVAFVFRRLLGRWFPAAAAACAGLAVTGVGAITPYIPSWSLWILGAGALVLFVMVLLLFLTGIWSKWGALAAGAAGLLGLGGLALDLTGEKLSDLFWTLTTVEFVRPWWLLLLLLVPVSILIAWRSLFRFDAVRPWIGAALRTAGVILLTLALAEPRLRQAGEHVTVLFVLDRSLSVPQDFGEEANASGVVDRRAERIRRFINNSVKERGAGHTRDRVGLIVFGKQPRLELPPDDVPRFNLAELPAARDGNYTDIGAAIKMALASFPEDTAKRMVVVSDGNENLGNAEEQARLAKSLNVQIDVVPLAAGQRNEEEVLVERVQAPSIVEQGSKVPIRVLVRSYNRHRVGGKLSLKQITEGDVTPIGTRQVELQYGLNPFSFDRPLTNEQRSYTYEAEFQPEWYEDADGIRHEGKPPGDRPQNNKASAHVVARGQRKILILEGKEGEQQDLVKKLLAAGKDKFKVVEKPVSVLDNYKDNDKLAVFLSNFDCVILANVPEEQVSEDQQKMLRSNTQDQGCGLIMIGGPDSFGAGGWQDTPVEKALPVDSEIKSLKVQGKGGLVLIMHGCEMADGNVWEKRIAKLAVQRLGPADEIGVLDGMEQWHIKLQEIGDNRASLLAQLDKLQPGDMGTFDNCLTQAQQALNRNDNDPEKRLATKHIIIISDGDPTCNMALLPPIKKDKITVTTVGVATHGAPMDKAMKAIADATGGNTYKVMNPSNLPAIYVKESRLVSQSFIEQKRFRPIVESHSGPTEGLPDPIQDLEGYVRTTPKQSPLVEIPIRTPKFADMDFPILAYWHYGLGKSVAFTSDAGKPTNWSRHWSEDQNGVYDKFWEQVVDWSLRPTESSRMQMITEYRDGKIHVTVDARTEQGDPDVTLTLRGGITTPTAEGAEEGGQKRELRFVQTNSGRYEATVAAEESGSYFINAQAVHIVKVKNKDGKEVDAEEGVDSVRAGVTLPYSPEFSEQETNAPLLEKLREITGGLTYADDETALAKAAAQGDLFRPAGQIDKSRQAVWQWVLWLAAILLLVDIAVRRVSVDTQKAGEYAWRAWARVRGIPLPPDKPEVLERLQNRKAQVGTVPVGSRARQRFEATGDYGTAPAGADATGPAPTPGTGARPAASRPDSPAPDRPDLQPGDALEALRRAKMRARGEDKDKHKPQK